MIEKIIISLMVLIALSGSLKAQEKVVTMNALLGAVKSVQLGFLINNSELIARGVKEIQEGRKVLEQVDNSKYLSFDDVQGIQYTKQKTNKIYMHAVKLEKEYNDGNKLEAFSEYEQLIRQCMECHMKLRDFEDKEKTLPKID